ncbi:hypothetical protein [Streptomyces sp. NPDC048638]|uniref:hypothetical protein n=1 Tax=Streptomyces sp. NPDC048638 TaxID=3365580 RepID=UPI003721B4E9
MSAFLAALRPVKESPWKSSSSFKTADVVRYVAGRPFAWVDDQILQADRDYVSQNHPGPALLYDVDPEVDLTVEDFEALAHWAGGLTLPEIA